MAAPRWASSGVHDDGMFVEAFSQAGDPIDKFRRVFVQARQIYCFCELGRLGWSGSWRRIVDRALGPFLSHSLSPQGDFVYALDSHGAPSDERTDLYTMAFGIFALGHAGEALGRADLFDLALKILGRLESRWARAQGGFEEGSRATCPPQRQNPHMHLFEAANALFRFTGEPRWYALSERMARLFQAHFLDQESGAVTEYFDEHWRPAPGREGRVVEPGHCFEWSWLFDTAPANLQNPDLAERLADFARRHVCARRRVAMMEVTVEGEIIDARARLWPQTERLKSAVARYERTGRARDRDEIVDAYCGLELFFAGASPGFWCDKLDVSGERLNEPTPASSFYHIVCALSTLLRSKARR